MRFVDRIDVSLPRKPVQSSLTRWFWRSLSEGRFETTQCTNCGEKVFPPRPDCPVCLERAMTWSPLSNTGSLYSRTIVHVVPEAMIDEAPLAIGIVDLDDGIRLLCALVGAEETAIGDRVDMVCIRYRDGCLFGAEKAGAL